MHRQGTVGRADMWDVDFPGQIPPSPVTYRTVPADGIELEGNKLLAVEVGHTDTDDTTVLHVPSMGLVVAGDVAYNGVHQYLLESAHGGIEAWLVALDEVAALRPRVVVAGHKNEDLPDDPAIIEQTREYLLDELRLLLEKPSPREVFRCDDHLVPGSTQHGPGLVHRRRTPAGACARSSVHDEVTHWFFDDYLTTWIGVGAGTIQRGPEFILDYWSAPLSWSDDHGSRWLQDPADVVAALQQMQSRLRNAGYADTAVPDRKVTVYHDNGAAIEVIWVNANVPTAPRSKDWPCISRWRAAQVDGGLSASRQHPPRVTHSTTHGWKTK